MILGEDTARCNPCGLYVSASSPPNPACQFPGTVALRHSLPGFCLRTTWFVSIDLFCSVFLGVACQAQRFEHFQSVIRHLPPSLSRSVLVMHEQLSRLTAPFAGSLRSFEDRPSGSFIEGCTGNARPHILQRGQDIPLPFD